MQGIVDPTAAPDKTLAANELLLPDSRVERLWGMLRAEFPALPDDFQLATYIQERRLVPHPKTSELVTLPEKAVFLIVSANPHPRHPGEMLKSIAAMSLANWRAEEENAWRFVQGGGDPAMKFLRALAKEHIAAYRNWKELN